MSGKLRFISGITLILLTSSPALADVKAGVDAWGRGDYPAAIKEWRAPAIAGDADAQFNMGQAYKLGRGVPIDLKMAEEWYRKAAAQGHAQAEDNYGLILFQNGDRQKALPIIERSANRGEPRAQYVFGTALFNGDLATKDWPRAYALMTRASAAGLAPASASLAQMDKYIPIDQRQRGIAMAREMEMRAAKPQLAMNDGPPLSAAAPVARPPVLPPVQSLPPEMRMPKETEAPRPPREPAAQPSKSWRTAGASALPRPGERVRNLPPAPQPAPEPEVYDDVAMAGGPDVSTPGAAYPSPDAYPADPLPPVVDTPLPVPRPTSRPAPARAPAPVKAPVAAQPAPVIKSVTGAYRIQLGAFGDASRAKALWTSLSGNVSTLKSLQPYLVKAGSITRLQAGPIASRAAADKLCGQVRGAAQSCLVVMP